MIIGPHIAKSFTGSKEGISQHILSGVEFAKKSGVKITAVSIFITGPKNYNVNFDADEAKRVKKAIDDAKLVGIAHSAYCNLPWDDKKIAIKSIKDEAKMGLICGFKGTVVHTGRVSAEKIIKALPKIITDGFTIYLEPTAMSEKKALYASPKALLDLFDEIDTKCSKEVARNVGLCIDTAHMWLSGVDLQTVKAASTFFKAFKGFKHKIMIHLNGAAYAKGSGKDTHAPLMFDKIWGGMKYADSGLSYIIKFAKFNQIPMILERPALDMLKKDYSVLSKIN